MIDSVKAQIGLRLREKREQAGYTREKLGELCSLSPRFIANIEFGDSTFSLDSLMTVCRVLSCSSDYLLFGGSVDAEAWSATAAKLPAAQQPKNMKETALFLSAINDCLMEAVDEIADDYLIQAGNALIGAAFFEQ